MEHRPIILSARFLSTPNDQGSVSVSRKLAPRNLNPLERLLKAFFSNFTTTLDGRSTLKLRGNSKKMVMLGSFMKFWKILPAILQPSSNREPVVPSLLYHPPRTGKESSLQRTQRAFIRRTSNQDIFSVRMGTIGQKHPPKSAETLCNVLPFGISCKTSER